MFLFALMSISFHHLQIRLLNCCCVSICLSPTSTLESVLLPPQFWDYRFVIPCLVCFSFICWGLDSVPLALSMRLNTDLYPQVPFAFMAGRWAESHFVAQAGLGRLSEWIARVRYYTWQKLNLHWHSLYYMLTAGICFVGVLFFCFCFLCCFFCSP